MVAFLSVIAISYALKHQWPRSEAFIGSAVLLAAITVIRPVWLTIPNKLWFQLGSLMGKITNPLVMGVLFFGLITPVALLARLLGRDALAMRQKNPPSYWIERTPDSSNTFESFQHQF